MESMDVWINDGSLGQTMSDGKPVKFCGGGAGYILNKEALRRIGPIIDSCQEVKSSDPHWLIVIHFCYLSRKDRKMWCLPNVQRKLGSIRQHWGICMLGLLHLSSPHPRTNSVH